MDLATLLAQIAELGTLTTEQIDELRASLAAYAADIAGTTDEDIVALGSIADAFDAIAAEDAVRAEATATRDAAAEAARARISAALNPEAVEASAEAPAEQPVEGEILVEELVPAAAVAPVAVAPLAVRPVAPKNASATSFSRPSHQSTASRFCHSLSGRSRS